jgi:4-amino-4-deoxy-L-arabinose transferase-like glycosyltransferase
MMFATRRIAPALFLLTVLAYLPGAWDEAALTQSDEFRKSMRTGLEMVEGGHVLVPYVDGAPRLEKPPLFYWVLFLSYSLLGPSLLAARLPGILFAAGAVCLTEALSRRTGGRAHAPGTAGLLALSSFGLVTLGRLALLDVPLLFFVLASVYCWVRFEQRDGGAWAVASLGALGLSALVKGPIGPFVGAAAIAGRLVLCGGRATVRGHGGALALGVVAFLATALAWPLGMTLGLGGEFLDVVRDELIEKRFVRGGAGGFTSVLGGLLLLAAPWTLFPLAVPGQFLRDAQPAQRREAVWLSVWIAATALPFLFMSTGFERYALPALPPALILAARGLRRDSRLGRVLRRLTALLILAAGAAVVALCARFAVGSPWALAACLFGLAVFAVGLLRPDRFHRAALGFALFQTVFFAAVYPALEINRLPQGLAREIGERPIASFGSRPPAMLSAALRRSVPGIGKDPADLEALARAGGWIAVSGESRAALEDHLQRLGYRWKVIREWRSLHTRSTAVSVTRRSARAEDLRRAFAARSLDDLKEQFSILGELERIRR